MKIAFKTAHGYLSFQPDGAVEYRDKRGPWEEIDIEGLDELFDPDRNLHPPDWPDKDEDIFPFGIQPSESDEYVAQIKEALLNIGIDLTGPCGAFEITRNVAWGLSKISAAGLLSKPQGNNCEGYATDIICYPNGQIIDILGDGGGQNNPIWLEKEIVEAHRYHPAINPE